MSENAIEYDLSIVLTIDAQGNRKCFLTDCPNEQSVRDNFHEVRVLSFRGLTEDEIGPMGPHILRTYLKDPNLKEVFDLITQIAFETGRGYPNSDCNCHGTIVV